MSALPLSRAQLIALGAGLALAFSGWGALRGELLIARGDELILELAPVDPRSLVQGDYMALDWQVALAAREEADLARARGEPWPRRGDLLLAVDERGVATYVRRHERGEPVPSGHHLLDYRIDGAWLEIVTSSWFFEEGSAEVYENAEHGLVRADEDGDAILVRMLDGELRPLGEPAARW